MKSLAAQVTDYIGSYNIQANQDEIAGGVMQILGFPRRTSMALVTSAEILNETRDTSIF
jgi:hypothetical protein